MVLTQYKTNHLKNSGLLLGMQEKNMIFAYLGGYPISDQNPSGKLMQLWEITINSKVTREK